MVQLKLEPHLLPPKPVSFPLSMFTSPLALAKNESRGTQLGRQHGWVRAEPSVLPGK